MNFIVAGLAIFGIIAIVVRQGKLERSVRQYNQRVQLLLKELGVTEQELDQSGGLK